MSLSPPGYPLYAVRYEKPDRFFGVLSALNEEWQRDRVGFKAIAQKAVPNEPALKKIKPSAMLAEKYRRQLVQETLEQAEIWWMDTVAEFNLGYLPINRREPLPGNKVGINEIYASLPRSGDKALRDKARKVLAAGEALQKQDLFWFATQVTALNQLFDTKH